MNKKYSIFWTYSAMNDLAEIIEYIALDSSLKAEKKLKEIKDRISALSKFPYRGRIIPELKKNNITKYRELIISPWRIFYKTEENFVYIMAVIDGRRNIEDILLRRNLK